MFGGKKAAARRLREHLSTTLARALGTRALRLEKNVARRQRPGRRTGTGCGFGIALFGLKSRDRRRRKNFVVRPLRTES